jgi:nucleotide-binding universal stress UspA family protein
MVTISRILCPVDFSEASAHAIEQVAHIARWFDARVVALHTYPIAMAPIPAIAMGGAPHGPLAVAGSDLQALGEQTSRAFAPVAEAGAAVEIELDPGPPAVAILERAATLPADLIVMGTHGTGGFKRLVLGSVTEKVLREARCPVLTVPPRAQATSQVPFKRLICAVDFSEASMAAMRYAVSLAAEADASLTVVHVLEWPWEEPPAPALDSLPAEVGFNLAAYRRAREGEAESRLAALVPEWARDWCAPETRIRHGKPYVEVLKAADEERADLIVVGVRGRNPVDMTVFGSTTNQLVRRATCPVLTVH